MTSGHAVRHLLSTDREVATPTSSKKKKKTHTHTHTHSSDTENVMEAMQCKNAVLIFLIMELLLALTDCLDEQPHTSTITITEQPMAHCYHHVITCSW
jgi:thiol:disulfide interchange protein